MNDTAWLVRNCNGAARLRLFCFPYAGGGADVYAGWHAGLPGVEVCAVQLPGRGARFREAPLDTFADLLTQLSQVVAQDRSLPFAFFGHCLGGLLAFELARYCQRHYLPEPARLIVSGAPAPRQRGESQGLHLLPDDELIAFLQRSQGTPPEVLAHKEFMALMLPSIRADFGLGERYVYRLQPPLGLPIAVYAGKDDAQLSAATLQGWDKETTEHCHTRWFNGGHFFLHTERDAVLAALREDLAAC